MYKHTVSQVRQRVSLVRTPSNKSCTSVGCEENPAYVGFDDELWVLWELGDIVDGVKDVMDLDTANRYHQYTSGATKGRERTVFLLGLFLCLLHFYLEIFYNLV